MIIGDSALNLYFNNSQEPALWLIHYGLIARVARWVCGSGTDRRLSGRQFFFVAFKKLSTFGVIRLDWVGSNNTYQEIGIRGCLSPTVLRFIDGTLLKTILYCIASSFSLFLKIGIHMGADPSWGVYSK